MKHDAPAHPSTSAAPGTSTELRGVLLVLTAAALWGTLGTFYTWATGAFGLTPLTIVFWRAALAALLLGLVLGVVRPLLGGGWDMLRVRRRDWPVFLTYGVLGVTAFYLLYIYAVLLAGVAVSVVLLYTAPAFVALMSWRWLGERFGARKAAALGLTLAGCVLVARAYDPSLLSLNLVGILCGLGSAFTYALYSILGKVSLRRGYPIATMSFYVYATGAIGLLVVALFAPDPRGGVGAAQLVSMGADVEAWALLLMLAVFQTIGALYAYTAGLRHLEAGTASILATFEPVVAGALAYFVVGERLEWPQIVGGGLVLLAVVLLQLRAGSRRDIAAAIRAD
jgi:DME family drug/metabolite transporter